MVSILILQLPYYRLVSQLSASYATPGPLHTYFTTSTLSGINCPSTPPPCDRRSPLHERIGVSHHNSRSLCELNKMIISENEKRLCKELRDFPRSCNYRWDDRARRKLVQALFSSLAARNEDYLATLFGESKLPPNKLWELRTYQGAEEGSEYSTFARGKPCGHIFKCGEATYRCKTCTADDTCVLCSKCFEASDHAGHLVYVSISPGNSGCCDCGDDEAWQIPVHCAIHTPEPESDDGSAKLKQRRESVPQDWAEAIRMTIGRALDYICDVISCSPEQLRLKKSETSIREDELASRLTSKWYDDDEAETDEDIEWALVLWNDEKHSVDEVQNQVSRACKKEKSFGLKRAQETDDVGRSVVTYSTDLKKLLQAAIIIEKIKITVTIRSSRDTFREQMCSAIIEWLHDVVGCHVGQDNLILQETVCKELLKPWRTGSKASNANVGRCGIDDHELEDSRRERAMFAGRSIHDIQVGPNGGLAVTVLPNLPAADEAGPAGDDENGAPAVIRDRERETEDLMDLDSSDGDQDTRLREPDDELEVSEATLAGYPPPPPPPPVPVPVGRARQTTPTSVRTPVPSDDHGSASSTPRAVVPVPRTPWSYKRPIHLRPPPAHWIERAWNPPKDLSLAEDIRQRVRLDWLILFDLRLWKKTRIDLRDLYISTVVTVPAFKRVLGLRFAGLYPVLAQLYLIADREPDHSIVYLSIQMLTTPSITQEIVEKGNFLTNLFAILYTFLTTRQVGHPWEVAANGTLAFDTGSVTNRRMYHFFMDIRHLFALDYVRTQLREDRRYPLQFLDLIKLVQGICPNRRAVGEHVEYETDTWISASILTRELNRLCRLFAEAFKCQRDDDRACISYVIRTFVKAAILNSIGAERERFKEAEVGEEVRFKNMQGRGFTLETSGSCRVPEDLYDIVDFVVEKEPISFHHALHYTISWLIEAAKSLDPTEVRELICFTAADLQEPTPHPLYLSVIPEHSPELYLMAFFDYPMRVCAWLAQMKAGMWVRNGLSLRHQMSTYRGVAQRDLAHQRDIFLLQTALVTCNPGRVLLTMIDRFELDEWMVGRFGTLQGYEDGQIVDIAEDFIHLLIVLLIERTSLVSVEEEPSPQNLAVRRDIIHILCFKPLSFSDLCNRLADKFQDLDDFQDVLSEMTNYRPPEGLNDSGTFELKPEYLAELDPFILHYSKNQRDESESHYRKWVSKTTGKPAAEVILEPNLRQINSGLFKYLGEFIRTEVFCQIIYFSLQWALTSRLHSPNVPITRVDAFLQVLLHLVLAAVLEDVPEDNMALAEPLRTRGDRCGKSFVARMLSESPTEDDSIFMCLQSILGREELASCHRKTRVILTRVQQKRPGDFAKIAALKGIVAGELGTDSPMSMSAEDAEAKKRQALERQAKVMAQFQKQQQDFLNNQANIDWGEDDFEDEEEPDSAATGEHKRIWKYPSGNCILCQEETNDSRFYGTFALLSQSRILRQTNLQDDDYVREVVDMPQSLDRSAEAIRPYGVAGQNRRPIKKITAAGDEITGQSQTLGKGFNSFICNEGPVSIGCGHIMHWECFELYCNAAVRRQTHQIARNHPERLDAMEFVCPLCKALGNAFLPIIWKGKEESYPGVLHTEIDFREWLDSHVGVASSRFDKQADRGVFSISSKQQESLAAVMADTVVAPALQLANQLGSDAGPTSPLRTIMNVMPGGFPDPTSPIGAPSESLALEQLLSIYRRVRETIKKNGLESRFKYGFDRAGDDLTYSDVLATALSHSIAAVEIAQRGIASEPGSLLLDKISPLSLTHLRILSETTSAYVAVGGSQAQGQNCTSEEFLLSHRRQLLQVFAGHPQIHEDAPWIPKSDTIPKTIPALTEEPFALLTEMSIFLVPALQLDILHVIRVAYAMEMTKVVLSLHTRARIDDVLSAIKESPGTSPLSAEASGDFEKFLKLIETYGELPALSATGPTVLPKAFSMVSAYILAFLRKTAILLHVRYGVDFPSQGFADIDVPEVVRLARAMRLPTVPELLHEVVEGYDTSEPNIMQNMVGAWVRHWRWMWADTTVREMALRGVRPAHPAIFELVGLPFYYDSLIEESIKRRCPSTGKEQVEPAICLFCGAIFCSQAVCCSKGGLGGCNQHMVQ